LQLAAARRYGRYTAKAMADRKRIAGLMRVVRDLVREVEVGRDPR